MTTIIPSRPDSVNRQSEDPSQVEQSTHSTKFAASPAHGMYPPNPSENPAIDPVCGMAVTVHSPLVVQHQAKTFHFCSGICKNKFVADPTRYLEIHADAAAPALQEPAAAGTVYTCPMHPEVRQDHPGACPKCGMALEPEMPILEEGDSLELRDFRRRFTWTLPLTLIVAVLAMAGHRLQWVALGTQSWIELGLTLPIVLWAGWPIVVRAVQSVIHRSPNMWTLIGLGTSAAFIYSVVATVVPGAFPASFVVMGRVSVYFEAAAVITSLTLLGQILN